MLGLFSREWRFLSLGRTRIAKKFVFRYALVAMQLELIVLPNLAQSYLAATKLSPDPPLAWQVGTSICCVNFVEAHS